MIDYRLHVFRQVAVTGSLTRASRVLHLSQPAVTKHIKLLEEELGVPLFVRSSSGVVPTDAGVVFLRHVVETEGARARVLEKLRAPLGQLSGCVRLGASMTIASYYLADALIRLKQKHPLVRCEVSEGNTEYIISLLLDQKIEAGLVEGPCRRREVRAQAFFEDEIIWIASPKDELARVQRPSLSRMLARPIISREMGSGTRKVVEIFLRQRGIVFSQLNIIQELRNTEAIKRMVLGGIAIAYVSRLSVHAELARGSVVEVRCPEWQLTRPFSFVTAQGPDPSGVSRAFYGLLRNKG